MGQFACAKIVGVVWMEDSKLIAYNVKNMKCTGLKAVSYPDTLHLIKGSTVQIRTNTRIFYI
jgi:hypothetical protein